MRRSPVFVIVLCLVVSSFAPLRAQDDVNAKMKEWSQALGVECTHCHLDGQWDLAYLPTFDIAYRMSKMVTDLNAGALGATAASPATPATRAHSARRR